MAADIFRERFADLSNAIREPDPIANKLFEAGIIGKASKDRAIQNNVPGFERTSELLSAVHDCISSDFRKPRKLNETIQVLMQFSETADIAEEMKARAGGAPVEERRVSFSIGPLNSNDEVDHSPQLKTTTVNNGTTSHTTVVEDKPKQSIDESKENMVLSYSNPPYGTVAFSVPSNLMRNFLAWVGCHPVTTSISVLAVGGLLIYFVYRRK